MTVEQETGAAADAAIGQSPRNPGVVTLDVESLTFGELCDIEDVVGVAAASTLLAGAPSPKAVTAAIWISKRRVEPAVTFEDVKALKVTSVEFG